MVEVDWTAPAYADLRAIHDFIARDSEYYATRMVERLIAATRRLAGQPRIGEIVAELPGSGYRQVLCGKYRVIYRYDEPNRRASIMAVIHASRDIGPILEQRLAP